MNLPTHLAKHRRQGIAAEIQHGLGSENPPHVSINGGRFTLVDSAGNKRPADNPIALDCIIIDTQKGTQRTFWGVGATYDADNATPPLCFSDNGVGASSRAVEPQSVNCQTCPMARFDSDVSKMTNKPVPACKKIKKIAVMLPGYDFPFLLRVPIMSHASLNTYSSQFNADVDVSDVITRVTFVEGKTGELQFELASYEGLNDLPYIDEGTAELRNKMLDDKKTDALVGRNDVPWQGALPASAQPQISAQPKPQTPPPPKPAQQAPQAQPGAFGQGAPKKAGRPAGAPNKPKAPASNNVAPFRTPPAAAPQAAAPKPSFGVQQAAEPPDELGAALDAAFELPT